jgi:putative membrane protein insertion efficiency factor
LNLRSAQFWRTLPRRLVRLPVLGYRFFLSPWLGSACRFEPTCSRYALEALERHGALAGSALTVTRLLRCHPGCHGGCDPVPLERPRLFRHLFPQATEPPPPRTAAPGADTPTSASAVMIDPLSSSRPLP